MQELVRIRGVTRPGDVDGGRRALAFVAAVAAGSDGRRAVIVPGNGAGPADSGILVAGAAVTRSALGVIEAGAGDGHGTLREVTLDAGRGRRGVGEIAAPPVRLGGALHGMTALAVAHSGYCMIEGGRANGPHRPVADVTAATGGGRGNVREGPTGPVRLGAALGQVAADTVAGAALGMIEGWRASKPDGPNVQVAVDAGGGCGAVAEAAAGPVRLRGAVVLVTALAVTGTAECVIERRRADGARRASASMAIRTLRRRGRVGEEAVAPLDSRAVVAARAVARATGVVGEAVDDGRRALPRVTFGAADRRRLVDESRRGPGHSGGRRVTGNAVADARIGVEHVAVHEGRGSNRRVAVEARRGRRGVVEGGEDPPAGAASGVALPAILAAAVDDGGAGRRIDDRRGPVQVVAFQAADVGERGVVGNAPFAQWVDRLR